MTTPKPTPRRDQGLRLERICNRARLSVRGDFAKLVEDEIRTAIADARREALEEMDALAARCAKAERERDEALGALDVLRIKVRDMEDARWHAMDTRDAITGGRTVGEVCDEERKLRAEVVAMEARKDAAYLERNQVVAALAKVFPACRARTAIEGWSEDWHGCVFIDLPTGQASWHFHDSQAYLFDFLPERAVEWDGHTTEEKYARLAALGDVRAENAELRKDKAVVDFIDEHGWCENYLADEDRDLRAAVHAILDAAREGGSDDR